MWKRKYTYVTHSTPYETCVEEAAMPLVREECLLKSLYREQNNVWKKSIIIIELFCMQYVFKGGILI